MSQIKAMQKKSLFSLKRIIDYGADGNREIHNCLKTREKRIIDYGADESRNSQLSQNTFLRIWTVLIKLA